MFRLVINPARRIGPVSPLIFGSFIENLERCIHGGVYDPGSPQADADGLRRDVIAHARAIGVSIVRFPGGCFAPYYHWRDGVGPVAGRPRTRYGGMELGGAKGEKWPSSNAFGTDEFVAWCRKVGAEPFICVNLGSGTPEEARDWVEYCNQPAGSRWADLRIANGHPEPYNVRWWAIGNEISGAWEFGHAPDPDDFVRRAREYARVMRQADPAIKLAIAGSHFPLDHRHRDWNRTVLEELHGHVDAITIHHYAGLMGASNVSGSEGPPRWDEIGPEAVHRRICRGLMDVEDAVRVVREDIRLVNHRRKKSRPISIGFTEYGIWYRTWLKLHDEHFNLADALALAAYFHIFIRNADVVTLANHAQLVHVLAPILVESGGAASLRQTIGLVPELFLPNRGRTAIDCWHDGPAWCEELGVAVPALDASASVGDDGVVLLNLTNRDPAQALAVDLRLGDGPARILDGRILGDGLPLTATNTFDDPQVATLRPWAGDGRLVVPAASSGCWRVVAADG